MWLAKVLGAVGRTMITAGVLILLFVVYQLYGTGLRQAQDQDRLERQFDAKLATTTTTTSTTVPPSTTPATSPPSTAAPLLDAPKEGDAVAALRIPRIGLTAWVVEGVGDDDLKKGPGHYPQTPLPGQKGNASIAGHRTTYGAPFGEIDSLQVGDPITITTVQGTFTYKVVAQADGAAHEIVTPDRVDVLDDKGDNRLTLTACHPKYSAAERIIVSAALVGNPLPAPPRPATTPAPAPDVVSGLSGRSASRLPAVLWALVCAAIWLAAWFVGKKWRKWPSYAIGIVPFLVCLFFFFESFSRLLPSNF